MPGDKQATNLGDALINWCESTTPVNNEQMTIRIAAHGNTQRQSGSGRVAAAATAVDTPSTRATHPGGVAALAPAPWAAVSHFPFEA
jgi:hypothetical protein